MHRQCTLLKVSVWAAFKMSFFSDRPFYVNHRRQPIQARPQSPERARYNSPAHRAGLASDLILSSVRAN